MNYNCLDCHAWFDEPNTVEFDRTLKLVEDHCPFCGSHDIVEYSAETEAE